MNVGFTAEKADIFPLLTKYGITKREFFTACLKNAGFCGNSIFGHNPSLELEQQLDQLENMDYIDYFNGHGFKMQNNKGQLIVNFRRWQDRNGTSLYDILNELIKSKSSL